MVLPGWSAELALGPGVRTGIGVDVVPAEGAAEGPPEGMALGLSSTVATAVAPGLSEGAPPSGAA